MRPYPILIAILALVAVSNLHAQSEKGRLPDGRAYRTDDEGLQLVDYIAELEVSVEDLKRRVVGLEDEVADKVQIIERLTTSQNAKGRDSVQERDLVAAATSVKAPQNPPPVQCPPQRSCAPCQPESPDSSSCRAFVEPVTEKLQNALQQLRELRSENTQLVNTTQAQSNLKREIDRERASRNDEVLLYQTKIQELERSLRAISCPALDCSAEISRVVSVKDRELSLAAEERAALERAVATLKTEQARIQEQAAALQRTAIVEADTSDLTIELALARSEISSLKSRLEERESSSAKAVPVRPHSSQAPLAERPAVQVASASLDQRAALRRAAGVTSSEANSGTANAARDRAVESVRGTIFSEFNRVRDSVSNRDRLFREFNSRSQKIGFKPSSAVSNSGRSLSDLNTAIRQARSMIELSIVRRELLEVRGKMNEDIQFMNRMGRRTP
jgi:hypothetical protein